jgi:hypothetical protein
VAVWDQQRDEPPEAFARFCLYRDFGPRRSLRKVYRASVRAAGREPAGNEGNGRQQPPGCWTKECSEFSWVQRAHAFDVCCLATTAQQAVLRFTHCVNGASLRLLEAITHGPGPATWQEVTEALAVIATFIPPESLLALTADPPDEGKPCLDRSNGMPRPGAPPS